MYKISKFINKSRMTRVRTRYNHGTFPREVASYRSRAVQTVSVFRWSSSSRIWVRFLADQMVQTSIDGFELRSVIRTQTSWASARDRQIIKNAIDVKSVPSLKVRNIQ
jgi:hypothetical protein